MSGEGPESIPTSADPRSHRPTKKRALTPSSSQAATLDALFAKPDQEIRIPPSAASGGGVVSRRPPPPEIITNVQGSSAGAGSGEFHVYKAARRREYERLREMDEQVKREREQADFERNKADKDKRDEEKTRKNREKREKMKARKMKKGNANGNANGPSGDVTTEEKEKPTSGTSTDHTTSQPQGRTNGSTDKAKGSKESTPPRTAAEPVGIVIHDDD